MQQERGEIQSRFAKLPINVKVDFLVWVAMAVTVEGRESLFVPPADGLVKLLACNATLREIALTLRHALLVEQSIESADPSLVGVLVTARGLGHSLHEAERALTSLEQGRR